MTTPKSIGEVEGFIVYFNRKRGKVTFFVRHKHLKGSDRDPIAINPEEIAHFLYDAVRYIRDPKGYKKKFVRHWERIARYVS